MGTEDAYKIKELGGVSALLSGRPSDALELISACKEAVEKFCRSPGGEADSDLTIAAFQCELRIAAGKRKEEIVRDYVQNTLGMSYATFQQIRKENFTDFHHHIWESITRLDLGADVIFCGFIGETPVIIRLDRFGRAPWETNYSAVGEGAEIARALLCLQGWSEAGSAGYLGPVRPVPLDHCIFRLYEAKTAAHRAHPSSVGEATAFQILISGAGRFGLHPDVQEALTDIFRLKHVVPNLGPLRYNPENTEGFLIEPMKYFSGPF